MSKRDIALSIVKEMSDEQIDAFLTLFADDDLLARIEAEYIAKDLASPSFDNADNLIEELLSE